MHDIRKTAAWQERLRPVMVAVLGALTAFFIVIGYLQFALLDRVLDSGPQLDVAAFMQDTELREGMTPADRLEAVRWKQLAMLEAHLQQQQYHQGKLYVVVRIWMRFLGFVVGMTMALLGAAFILGKLREEATNIELKSADIRLSLLSTSPGIILAVLGTALMAIAMLASADINVSHNAVYTARWSVPVTTVVEDAATTTSPLDNARARLLDESDGPRSDTEGVSR